MKYVIYGERIKNGICIERVEIGTAYMEDRVSARKYNELWRNREKLMGSRKKNEHFQMKDGEGRISDFCGYPALKDVIWRSENA